MRLFVDFQIAFCCEPFVTDCTQIWSWFVIMWMLIICNETNTLFKCCKCKH